MDPMLRRDAFGTGNCVIELINDLPGTRQKVAGLITQTRRSTAPPADAEGYYRILGSQWLASRRRGSQRQ